MDEKNNMTINFRQMPASLVLVIAYLLSLWMVYLQVKRMNFELFLTILSIFCAAYPSLIIYNIIDEIVYDNGILVLKKKLKTHTLSNIASVKLIRLRVMGSVLLKIQLENRKTIIGFYSYNEKEHKKLVDLIKTMNVTKAT